jgi:ABC-type nitrate/sulfonate/bicarbonate transport system substrate-binding protein
LGRVVIKPQLMLKFLQAAANVLFVCLLFVQVHAADRVRLGYSSVTANRLPLWLGQEAGIFARHGIDAEMLLIPSGTTGVQALVAGEVQILSATGATAVAAALRGADVVIIGSLGVIEYKLAALPQIRTVEALKGKRVGISRFGSFTDFASRRVLRHVGLNPEKDVVLLQTGIAGATQRLMAMFNGTMDATLTQVDTILLAQIKLGKEVSVLGGLLDTGYRATGADIMTSRRFLKEKPDIARRFMIAIVEGIHMARTQKDRTLRMLSKQLNENDPRILEAQYRTFVIDAFPTKPYPDEVTVRFSLEELDREFPGAKDKNVSQFIDGSLLKAIDESGFIDQLYK